MTVLARPVRSISLPSFGLVAGHCLIDHGVYLGDVKRHTDAAAAHAALHRGGLPSDQFLPHVHPEMAPTPTHAPVDVEECDWCGEPIAKGEPVWWHLIGLAHAWHPGERP